MRSFFRHGGALAWGLVGAVLLLGITSGLLVASTANVRLERDIARIVFNHNLELLEDVKRKVGESSDTLHQVLSAGTEMASGKPFIVVSIADHRLWYKEGPDVVFSTQVATGSGKVLAQGGSNQWKFETPRGRLVVQSKESDPVWVPPDWHYIEAAKKKSAKLIYLKRGKDIPVGDGSVVTVSGNDVVRKFADGREVPFDVKEGKEIIVNNRLIVPPFGTNQRKYLGVLGNNRLNLGDGYALHGTNEPESVGRSVSHGCVRLRNEDIETLFRMVPIGTPVFIY
jgi:lipoprotein-anchoring transpeptidase ErfK/SrfK